MPLFNKEFSIKESQKNLKTIISLVEKPPHNWTEILLAANNKCFLVTFVNPSAVNYANKSCSYTKNLELFDLVLSDGFLFAKIASLWLGTAITRISFDGNSLSPIILSSASKLNLKVFIIGGPSGVSKKAAINFEENFGIITAGCRHGFFKNNEEMDSYCKAVAEKRPNIVLCGMGIGLQEKFLLCLRRYGWNGVGFTCGGYLEQVARAGGIDYYPGWINSLNFRAFYRVYREPKRLGWRYVHDYWPFYISAAALLINKLCKSWHKAI